MAEAGKDIALLNMACGYNITMLFQKYCVLGHFSQTLEVEALQSQSLAKIFILRGFLSFFMCVSNFLLFLLYGLSVL